MSYFTYILTNKTNSIFYTGVTNDLSQRVFQHKEKIIPGFTKKYNVDKLVYYEVYDEIIEAIAREKLIKKWRKEIKRSAINGFNSNWDDLYFIL